MPETRVILLDPTLDDIYMTLDTLQRRRSQREQFHWVVLFVAYFVSILWAPWQDPSFNSIVLPYEPERLF